MRYAGVLGMMSAVVCLVLLGGCSGDKSNKCEEHVAIQCHCAGDLNGAQMCVDGKYQACDCSGATAPSVPSGSVGICVYKELSNGKRICLLSESQVFGNFNADTETQTSALWPYPEDEETPEYEEPSSEAEDLFAQCPKFHFHDQGPLGWCVAHSTEGAMELKYCIDNDKPESIPLSEPHLWHLGRPNDSLTGLCYRGGWYVQEAVNIAEYEFLSESSVWPYPKGMNCDTVEGLQATDQAVAGGYPGESVLEMRDDFTIHGHQHINEQDSLGIRANLAVGHPVVTSVPTFENVGWYSDEVDENGAPVFESIRVPDSEPTSGNSKKPYCSCGDASLGPACPEHEHCFNGYHAIFLVGYDNATQRFRMVNSWGGDWKKNYWGESWETNGGTFYIDYEYIEKYSRGGEGLFEVWKGDSSDNQVIPSDKEPGQVGTPCLSDAACSDGEGICLIASMFDLTAEFETYLETGFEDGYCTVECKFLPGFECPEGTTCVSPSDRLILNKYYAMAQKQKPKGVCIETCELQDTVQDPNPCRPGYGCHPRGKDEAGVCLPRCRDNDDCSGPGPSCSSDTGACIWGCAEGLCTVPEGTFTMGCDESDWDCGWGDTPAYSATMSAFDIDRNEVSRGEYYECVEAGSCTLPEAANSMNGCSIINYGKNEAMDSDPVNCVDWDQANAYCLWKGKRLCTEAEWEKAARGAADARETPWGGPCDDIKCDQAQIFWENYLSGSPKDCNPGGQESPKSLDWPFWMGSSPYGIQHMTGNVMEWTADWADEAIYNSGSSMNPTGPTSGTEKILRGHHFRSKSGGQGLRLSVRYPFKPDSHEDTMGIRCCKDSGNGSKIPWDKHFLPPFMH
jgi:formylglycine-generating enzyme